METKIFDFITNKGIFLKYFSFGVPSGKIGLLFLNLGPFILFEAIGSWTDKLQHGHLGVRD